MGSGESPKVLCAVLLVLAVLGSTLASSPPPVFATTVYQLPACGDAIAYPPGTTVVLTGNIGPCSGNGLIIGQNSVTLDCAGNTISGTHAYGYVGINLTRRIGVMVKNCNVTGFAYGFRLTNSSSNRFSANTANDDDYYAFYLWDSSSNTLTGNTARNDDGFYLRNSDNNTLTENTASNCYFGFDIERSSNNTLTGNTADSSHNSGFFLLNSPGNTLSGNTADSNDNAGFYLTNSPSNTLNGNTANNNLYYGFYLESSSDSNTLNGNTANNNLYYGFYLWWSSSNTLTGNTANSNYYGFSLAFISFGNTLTKNAANDNGRYGFSLNSSSSGNTLTANTANSNTWYGYSDGSTGSGTAGTANLYTFDICANNNDGSSSPNGLCPPFILLSLFSGSVGASVTITGANLVASSDLATRYDSSTSGMPSSCSTNSAGAISSDCTFTVPPSAYGPHTIFVFDGANSPTTTFRVTSSVFITPSAGPAGATVTASGTGFVASHAVSATFDNNPVLLGGTCTTTSVGGLSGCTFTVPASAFGAHIVTVSDGTNSPTTAFTVFSLTTTTIMVTTTTTEPTTFTLSTTLTETTTQPTTITTTTNLSTSTFAYVALTAMVGIVVFALATLAAWVLRGRKPELRPQS